MAAASLPDAAAEAPADSRPGPGADTVAEGLTNWSVSADGARVELGFEDNAGRAFRLHLPFEAISAMLLIIPRIIRMAMRARGGPGRMVHRLAAWDVARGGAGAPLVLTLSTPMGFETQFAVTPEQLAAIGRALPADGAPADVTLH